MYKKLNNLGNCCNELFGACKEMDIETVQFIQKAEKSHLTYKIAEGGVLCRTTIEKESYLKFDKALLALRS